MVVDEKLSITAVRNTLQRFQDVDDVFNSDFLGFIIFLCNSDTHCQLSGPLSRFLESVGSLQVGFLSGSYEALSEGPYFASSQGLFRVWKLVPDIQGAFVATLVETSSQRCLVFLVFMVFMANSFHVGSQT